MRDLGTMGESTFTLWCADAGLVANGSKIDRTGWDFLVEFPFNTEEGFDNVHESAIECRVQVKATDTNKRKIAISLANLRRLVTVNMPSFIVLIEFDKSSSAKNCFILHVDNLLITKVLKRIHEVDQSPKDNNFNKRTMSISFQETNRLSMLNGNTLRDYIAREVGCNMASYVESKKQHLKSTGFETGYGTINFNALTDKIERLVDVSLGLQKSCEIESFKVTKSRFGIDNKSPFLSNEGGRLEMPGIKPSTTGLICFKKNKFSKGYCFKAKLYISPFNKVIPDKYAKARIEGEFFDLAFHPFNGKANYNFSFGDGVKLNIFTFRDALRLLFEFSIEDNILISELKFENFPKLQFNVSCHYKEFAFNNELEILECACEILKYFDIVDDVKISLLEIINKSEAIKSFHNIITNSNVPCKVEFSIKDKKYQPSKSIASMGVVSVSIGQMVLGVVYVVTGEAKFNDNINKFEILSDRAFLETKIISTIDTVLSEEDLIKEIELVGENYQDSYDVVILNE